MQEYEQIKKQMGTGKYNAIDLYLQKQCPDSLMKHYEKKLKEISSNPHDVWLEKKKELENKYNIIFLSDVLYKSDEYRKFDAWFYDYLKPFNIFELDDEMFEVYLSQEDYHYDWLKEEIYNSSHCGDGHCYEDLFREYLENNFQDLNNRLDYDSENGMFCVYCQNKQDAEEVGFELSKLYKDENLMIQLIKETKEKYNYIFDDIKI